MPDSLKNYLNLITVEGPTVEDFPDWSDCPATDQFSTHASNSNEYARWWKCL